MNNNEIILLDTNTVMYLIKGDETVYKLVDQRPVAINFITEIELLSWPFLTKELTKIIIDLISNVQYFDYSSRIKQTAISLRRKYKLKLGDAFIASTALEYNLPLLSADRHFQQVDEIQLIKFTPSI